MADQAKKAPAAPRAPKRYFIVNPAGAIHEVDREHARWRLGQVGFRMATPAEVAELDARSGEQRADSPICARWSPDPDAQLDVDEA
jgi:hypothetical protein